MKCSKRQELVIGGYSLSDKPARPFASLLLGAYEGDELIYRGRVGTGFDEDTMDKLAKLLERRARKTSPFAEVPANIARSVRYVTPDLVAEIEFTEFTAGGSVRHGVYKGLREDKEAKKTWCWRSRAAADNSPHLKLRGGAFGTRRLPTLFKEEDKVRTGTS
ncbi:hypothetical protein QW131_29595 [Roseibium salinum]|nr:hypothetical protein [Roseibium salinum]